MDIYIKNLKNKSPFEYVKNYDIPEFIEVIVDSYIYCLGYHGCTNEKCRTFIKTKIINEKQSFPHIEVYDEFKDEFKMIMGEEVNYGKFNSDTIHSIIYTLCMLEKYDNLCIPFQYYNNDKFMNDKLLNEINLYKTLEDTIIFDIVDIYTNLFYEIVPYLMLWNGPTKYYYHRNLNFYLKKCFLMDKIRFICIKLTLIPSYIGTHANILIFDKKTKILERFEPYGIIPFLEIEKLDKMIGKKIIKYFEEYYGPVTYLAPKDYMQNINFQMISNDADINVKKLGDPAGYCLAWTFWYLELRINNPDIHPKKLVKYAFDAIRVIAKENNDKVDGETIFIDFIRNYSSKLDVKKNSFLCNAGIKEKNIYNITIKKNDRKKIMSYILTQFNNCIKRSS